MSAYPVVVADNRKYYIETNRSHYNHAHPSIGLDETEHVLYGTPKLVEKGRLVFEEEVCRGMSDLLR